MNSHGTNCEWKICYASSVTFCLFTFLLVGRMWGAISSCCNKTKALPLKCENGRYIIENGNRADWEPLRQIGPLLFSDLFVTGASIFTVLFSYKKVMYSVLWLAMPSLISICVGAERNSIHKKSIV